MTAPHQPTTRPVDYKGEPLDAERGPGLGCFWSQLGTLIALLILTPLTVVWAWPAAISAALLFLTLIILLFAGQTVIFLLRLVAADRRDGRRVPLAATSQTVGEIEDEIAPADAGGAADAAATPADAADPGAAAPAADPADPSVREWSDSAAEGTQGDR